MNQGVLHVDFISLAAATSEAQIAAILERAASLHELESVVQIAAIRAVGAADCDLAIYFLLRDFLSLEPFGTDERYTRFLQADVAPHLRGFTGIDVRLESELNEPLPYAALLALDAPDEAYDWEIRQALAAWLGAINPPAATDAFGLAAGERQRYRGLAVAFSAEPLVTGPKPSSPGTIVVSGRVTQL